MNIEEQLTRELGRTAARAHVTTDASALARMGRREQRLRRTVATVGGGALALALIGGVALGTQLNDPSSNRPPVANGSTSPSASATPTQTTPPQTIEEMPLGPGSLVPWWGDGVLHVGDTEIETDLRYPIHAGSTVLVGNTGENGSVWRLVEDGELGRTVVDEPAWVRPQLSPGGTKLLTSTTDAQGLTSFTVTDVASDDVVGTLDVQGPTECCVGIELLMLDDDGRIAYRLDNKAWVWTPGGEAIRITGVDAPRIEPLDGTGQGYAGGIIVMGEATKTSGNASVVGSVGVDGAFTPTGVVPDSALSRWNATGSMAAYPGNDSGESDVTKQNTSVWVQGLDSSPARLALPVLDGKDYWFPVGWEDDTHVIVRRADRVSNNPVQWSYQLARCDVTTLVCERAGEETGPAITVEDS